MGTSETSKTLFIRFWKTLKNQTFWKEKYIIYPHRWRKCENMREIESVKLIKRMELGN